MKVLKKELEILQNSPVLLNETKTFINQRLREIIEAKIKEFFGENGNSANDDCQALSDKIIKKALSDLDEIFQQYPETNDENDLEPLKKALEERVKEIASEEIKKYFEENGHLFKGDNGKDGIDFNALYKNQMGVFLKQIKGGIEKEIDDFLTKVSEERKVKLETLKGQVTNKKISECFEKCVKDKVIKIKGEKDLKEIKIPSEKEILAMGILEDKKLFENLLRRYVNNLKLQPLTYGFIGNNIRTKAKKKLESEGGLVPIGSELTSAGYRQPVKGYKNDEVLGEKKKLSITLGMPKQ